MYKVIKYFTDLHDKNHPYKVGDEYPRKGIKVTDERIAELAGSDNKQKTPLIELVGEAEDSQEEASELEGMTIAQLKELAAQNGIDTAGLKKKADYIAAIGAATE